MPFLDWVNKNQAKGTSREVPYHLLKRESTYGDAVGASENLIIQGDNLLALKALLPFYAGQVKCIFIDPPYNTKSAFEHYDDNLEHSQWLSMMYPRLVLLRDLLAENGSIWVTIDDNESHYLKVMMDEVFGRVNFVSSVIWQKIYTVKNSARHLSEMHDHILVYAKKINSWQRNLLPRSDELNETFTNPDDDPLGPWTTNAVQARNYYSHGSYAIASPAGKIYYPPNGTYWRVSEETFQKLDGEGRVWWGKKGDAIPRIKRYLAEVKQGVVPATLWLHGEAGQNAQAKDEVRVLANGDQIFSTPKPERLISKILTIASNPGDIVLDSFLGSGTTAAVAHKMGRRFIGIEMGQHAKTHCVPRLEKVIAGEQGGISGAVGWQGGGGFSFYTLGDPAFDEDGRLNTAVKFTTLAAYVWHVETGAPGQQSFDSPLLGVHAGVAYFLLYNGILGDRRPSGGNVLTSAILAHLRELCPTDLPFMVYGETSRIGPARLAAENIRFKQIPYDVSMR